MPGPTHPLPSRTYAILLIAPFAVLAAFLSIQMSPGALIWQLFAYALFAVLITGIWAGVSSERWSGRRFAATFAILLMTGIALMSIGRMSTAQATDPAETKPDPWIILSD